MEYISDESGRMRKHLLSSLSSFWVEFLNYRGDKTAVAKRRRGGSGDNGRQN